MKSPRYYCIAGLLGRNGRLELRPGYLSEEGPETKEDGIALVSVAFFDDRGTLVRRSALCARPLHGETMAIIGRIPFPASTRCIRFYRQDAVIETIKVPEGKPRIKLLWKSPERASGVQAITWEASQEGQERLFFMPRYSRDDGKSWVPVGGFTTRSRHELDLDRIPGGSACRFSVLATNGVTSATALSEKFEVAIKPCCALIQGPQDRSRFAAGQSVELRGNGYWMEEDVPELERLSWSSSIDGDLGAGGYLPVHRLTPGKHRITLAAGSGDRLGRAWVDIQIEEK